MNKYVGYQPITPIETTPPFEKLLVQMWKVIFWTGNEKQMEVSLRTRDEVMAFCEVLLLNGYSYQVEDNTSR